MKIRKRRRQSMACHDCVLLGIAYFRNEFSSVLGIWGRYV